MNRDVIAVEYLKDWKLRLTFQGNEVREVDVASLVPFEGVFEPIRDVSYFRSVRVDIEIGTITWPNGADICPDVLFEQ